MSDENHTTNPAGLAFVCSKWPNAHDGTVRRIIRRGCSHRPEVCGPNVVRALSRRWNTTHTRHATRNSKPYMCIRTRRVGILARDTCNSRVD